MSIVIKLSLCWVVVFPFVANEYNRSIETKLSIIRYTELARYYMEKLKKNLTDNKKNIVVSLQMTLQPRMRRDVWKFKLIASTTMSGPHRI
jgi:hypothetical protein